ncbi:MAG: hypothetical protein KIT83_01540 [Bryobacterales bacterium]|nr:hypothetical protein [Bryobacterales bacterium]
MAGTAAQSASTALNTTEKTPPTVSEGLRDKQPSAPLNMDLRPDQRGDIFMARKVYRSAVDSYQEAIADVTAERAETLRLSAVSLRELNREGDARGAESAARDLDKKSRDITSKQKTLPGSGGNFFTRLLAALGLVSNSPPGPSDTATASVAPVFARTSGDLEMPEGLSQKEQAEFWRGMASMSRRWRSTSLSTSS